MLSMHTFHISFLHVLSAFIYIHQNISFKQYTVLKKNIWTSWIITLFNFYNKVSKGMYMLLYRDMGLFHIKSLYDPLQKKCVLVFTMCSSPSERLVFLNWKRQANIESVVGYPLRRGAASVFISVTNDHFMSGPFHSITLTQAGTKNSLDGWGGQAKLCKCMHFNIFGTPLWDYNQLTTLSKILHYVDMSITKD